MIAIVIIVYLVLELSLGPNIGIHAYCNTIYSQCMTYLEIVDLHLLEGKAYYMAV